MIQYMDSYEMMVKNSLTCCVAGGIAYMMKGPVETIESNEYVRTPSSGGGGEGGHQRNVDFSEFMWMADEELEDFDRRVRIVFVCVRVCVYIWMTERLCQGVQDSVCVVYCCVCVCV